ncbi:ABC transporter permease [Cohaesibacter haloalkalitolerans]|uniref:ABC transporter permease n=1 Tax=Cohaesibacter haloalkalitolerans TaxID=1162980 RepID=UPI000E658130|nr:ABC transporter permease [Cohaesibacter haloalkalitolerans]
MLGVSRFIKVTDINAAQLRSGAYRQRSAIWALVFKEFKIRLGKSRIGFFWTMVEPIIGMIMFGLIRLSIGQSEVHHVPVMLFIGTGFIVFNAFRSGMNFIPNAIIANQGLLNYPQVKPIDTILARFILSIWLHLLASSFMLLLLWWVTGDHPSFVDPLLCIQTLVLATLLGLGVAFLIAIYGTQHESVFKLIGIIGMPMMILSGVMISMNELSASARQYLAWNPIIHLVEGFRHGAFGTRLFPEYDLGYPTLVTVLLLGLGYALYYNYRFKLLMK